MANKGKGERRNMAAGLLTRSWRDGAPDEEFLAEHGGDEQADLLFKLVLGIKTRTATNTIVVKPDISEKLFRDMPEANVTGFLALPRDWQEKANGIGDVPWRVVLASSDTTRGALGLDIYGEITAGRARNGVSVDLNLSAFGALEAGVSARHALIRPTHDKLLLMDLGSTNGTFRNGERLQLAVVHEIEDGDTLTFGGLHFRLRVVSRPGG